MRRSQLLLSRKFLIGILIWFVIFIPESEPLRGSALILQAKSKAAQPKPETDLEITNNNGTISNGSISTTNVTKSQFTGIPQIDYVLDPNLPRELNGHNLTDYPFYNAVPEEIDFKCDGLHDGFYASVPHKCQVYHHCLFGTRFDFLCANYTAFDQKTFICHFVSEVDCDNSPKYYKRNEALYKEATTPSTTTTTTTTPSTTTAAANSGGMRHGNEGMRHGGEGTNGRRRRPYYRRRRPVYEYYYDDEEYADSEYYDDEVATMNHRRNPNRKHNKDHHADNHATNIDDEGHADAAKPSSRIPHGNNFNIYDRSRIPPKVRRPVPKKERERFDYTSSKTPLAAATTTTTTTTSTEPPQSTSAPKPKTSAPADDEYYDYEDEYEYDEPKSTGSQSQHHADYDIRGGHKETRHHTSRHPSRNPPRKHADMYDDYDVRPKTGRRKEHPRYSADQPRNARPMSHRVRQEDTAPSYSKKRLVNRGPEKRPTTYTNDNYYDEEELEEDEEAPPPPPKHHQRPNRVNEKSKPNKTRYNSHEQTVPEQKQYEFTTKNPKPSNWPSTKSSPVYAEEDTPRENEIPTTEHVRATAIYKKTIPNSPKEEDDSRNSVSTEETKSLPAYSQGYVPPRTLPKLPVQKLQHSDALSSRNIAATPMRHYVIATPIRKPSHFRYSNNVAEIAPQQAPAAYVSYRDEIPSKLPEQPKVVTTAAEYYKATGDRMSHFVRVPQQNTSSYQPVAAHGTFYIPVAEQTSRSQLSTLRKKKPVEKETLPDTQNSNGIYSTGLATESKSFESTARPQAHRQEPQLYGSGDRLYTNSIVFPHQPPNFDITAPGPSGLAEDSNLAAAVTMPVTAPERKYPNLSAYNAANNYRDIAYDRASQPSATHSVRRYPTTIFFVQNGPTASR